jgi:hypothetical protein
LIEYRSALTALTLAPKNCICLPTRMGETQQAIAASSPISARMISSDSNWIAEVSIDTWAQKRLKPSGRASLHSTVRFGSGAAPILYSVWRKRKVVLVTSARPSSPMPASDSVTQVGSPAKISYSGYAGSARCGA